ncbi:MAG: hypothetical protein ACREAA_02165 [Candidatus Polarisedimenticolia bacterium]
MGGADPGKLSATSTNGVLTSLSTESAPQIAPLVTAAAALIPAIGALSPMGAVTRADGACNAGPVIEKIEALAM